MKKINDITQRELEVLAIKVVDSWEMETLLSNAIENLIEFYQEGTEASQEVFADDWETFMDADEEE